MQKTGLDASMSQEMKWNTHIACLERITAAAGRGLDLVDVAGITGLAFRTALCAGAGPSSVYQTWSFTHEFRRWLDALGIDADVSEHDSALAGFHAWLDRRHDRIHQCLARGFPALFWDNLGFALILQADEETYQISGIPSHTVHPIWTEHPETKAISQRLGGVPDEDQRQTACISRSDLIPLIDTVSFFAYPHGVCGFDIEAASRQSLLAAHRELSGMLEYRRAPADLESRYEPEYGTQALSRWRDELERGRVHDWGQITCIQTMAEARQWAWLYFKRLPDRLDPRYKGRLDQITDFYDRIAAGWRGLARIWNVPLDRDEQMVPANWEASRELLYQIQQTENTAGRLLAGIALELHREISESG